MPIFTIEVQGRAVLAFVAPNLFTAQAALEDEGERIQSGLTNVANPDGSPLMDARARVTVREAQPEEESVWHAGVSVAIEEGALSGPHDAITEGFAVYLVAVTPANDDDIAAGSEET